MSRQRIDREKLQTLRDRHDDLVDRYRAMSRRALEASMEAKGLYASVVKAWGYATTYDFLQKPIDEQVKLSDEAMKAAYIDPDTFRRYVRATARAQTLRAEANAFADSGVRPVGVLMNALETYAKEFQQC